MVDGMNDNESEIYIYTIIIYVSHYIPISKRIIYLTFIHSFHLSFIHSLILSSIKKQNYVIDNVTNITTQKKTQQDTMIAFLQYLRRGDTHAKSIHEKYGHDQIAMVTHARLFLQAKRDDVRHCNNDNNMNNNNNMNNRINNNNNNRINNDNINDNPKNKNQYPNNNQTNIEIL